MKAEELMVGDWVRITDDDTNAFFDAKVGTLTRVENIFVVPPGEEMAQPFSIDCVEPIPITPEILEKNGFEEFDGWRILDMDDVEIRWIGTTLEISGSRGNMDLPDVQCVHELQHALRLCGIDKTIEL